MPSFTCMSCRVAFADGDIQRAHYKSDWHRYNLKRKVAEMPPITAESFREKVLAQQSEKSVQEKNSNHCHVCNKSFASDNAFANHLKSKKHREQQIRKEKEEEVMTSPIIKETESVNDDDDDDCVEVDDESLETTQCLFCPHFSTTFEDNMRHMTRSHSFFIPDVQYVINVQNLIGYLGEKVGLGKICLYCSTKSKTFHSIEAVQKHMVDRGHCKMFYEDEDVLEYSDFYDFSSSYPDGQNNADEGSSDMEVNPNDAELSVSTNGELCLPSGIKVGHRSLRNYYRQCLKPEQMKRNQIVVKGLMTDYKMLGYNGNIGAAHRLQIQTMRMKEKFIRRQQINLNMKANKMQPHFREQVRY